MSEPAGVETPPAGAPPAAGEAPSDDKGEGLAFGSGNSVAFGDLMDVLVSEEEQNGTAPGTPAAGADGATEGQPAAPAEGAPAAGATTDPPATGDAGKPAVPADGTPPAVEGLPIAPGGDLPADWTQSVTERRGELDQLTTDFETAITKQYQEAAYQEVMDQHPKYFEAIAKNPRLLVGEKVPSLKPDAKPEDTETLKDEADVISWQKAVQSILVDEVKAKAAKGMEDNLEGINMVHANIQLFQNNPDLVPRTKEFDKELAERLAKMTKPYEVRVEGKLKGYSIPVQPLVDTIRADLKAARTAAPAAGETPPAGAPAATPPKPEDPPQAGIPSKAGASAEQNTDIQDLFGTLGEQYRNIRI